MKEHPLASSKRSTASTVTFLLPKENTQRTKCSCSC